MGFASRTTCSIVQWALALTHVIAATTTTTTTTTATTTSSTTTSTDGGGWPWWAWFLLVLGICCLLNLVFAGVHFCVGGRKKRRGSYYDDYDKYGYRHPNETEMEQHGPHDQRTFYEGRPLSERVPPNVERSARSPFEGSYAPSAPPSFGPGFGPGYGPSSYGPPSYGPPSYGPPGNANPYGSYGFPSSASSWPQGSYGPYSSSAFGGSGPYGGYAEPSGPSGGYGGYGGYGNDYPQGDYGPPGFAPQHTRYGY